MVIGPPDHFNLLIDGFIGLIGPPRAKYQARAEKSSRDFFPDLAVRLTEIYKPFNSK